MEGACSTAAVRGGAARIRNTVQGRIVTTIDYCELTEMPAKIMIHYWALSSLKRVHFVWKNCHETVGKSQVSNFSQTTILYKIHWSNKIPRPATQNNPKAHRTWPWTHPVRRSKTRWTQAEPSKTTRKWDSCNRRCRDPERRYRSPADLEVIFKGASDASFADDL